MQPTQDTTPPPPPPASSPEAPKGGGRLRRFGGGCLAMVLAFILIGVLAQSTPALAAVLTVLAVLWLVAAVIGRFVPAAPAVLKGQAGNFGIALAVALTALVALWSGLGAEEAMEKKRAADLARVPELVQEMETQIAEAQWGKASRLHEEISEIQPDHPSLAPAWAKISPELKRIEDELAEQQRARTVASSLDRARQVVEDDDLCTTPKAIAEAWDRLRLAKPNDAQWSEAQVLARRLERCRQQTERALSQGVRDVMRQQRADAAQKLERTFLDQGLSAEVAAQGQNKDRLQIKYPLITKAWAHKLTDNSSKAEGSFLANMENIGFRRVTFTDGFQESWYYDLTPPKETEGGKKVLEEMGLGEPLKLE